MKWKTELVLKGGATMTKNFCGVLALIFTLLDKGPPNSEMERKHICFYEA
jgi:hypothetical protein